jgi:hypothetical protein
MTPEGIRDLARALLPLVNEALAVPAQAGPPVGEPNPVGSDPPF